MNFLYFYIDYTQFDYTSFLFDSNFLPKPITRYLSSTKLKNYQISLCIIV